MYLKKVAIISKNTGGFYRLQRNLNEVGIDTHAVSTIEDILGKYITPPFVLAVIDANSYKDQTPKLVRYLYGAKPAPILVMMSKSCLCNRLELLRMGATVCLNMETTPEEQAAQAEALIQIYSARDDNLHRETLFFGTALVINPIYRIVILNGERINLTRREFDLLYLMAKHDNRVFTPEQIYKQLWGDEDGVQVGSTIKSSIRALRKKLEPVGYDYIQNVWGTGYRFVGNSDKI